MKMTAAAVLFLVDGFTGYGITDSSVPVILAGGQKVIRKPEGFYVILDNGAEVLNLSAGGGIYQVKKLCISTKESGQRKSPCRTVYLYPGVNYPFPEGIIREKAVGDIVGNVEMVLWEDSKNAVTLLKDYAPGDKTVFLGTRGTIHLEDRPLYFCKKEGEIKKLFLLGETIDIRTGEYRVEEPAVESFESRNTEIYLAYELSVTGINDEIRGICYLPHIR